MKIIIYTSFDCLLKTDSWQETLEENQNLTLDSKPNRLAVYPIGKTARPSFEIDFDKNQSPFYRIVEKDEKLLVFLLDGIFAQNIKVYSLSCNEKNCQIEISKNAVTFVCSGNKKVLSLPEAITDSTAKSIHHIAFAKVKTAEQEYVFAYNTKNYHSKIIKGEDIELTSDGFVVTSSAHGYQFAKEEYVITREGLKIKDRTFSALSLPNFEKTLSFRFLNAVKLGDYNSALSMLAPSLTESVTQSSLHEYFGNLSYIFPLDENTCFAISNNQNIIYSFIVSNNKITEISDNQ